MPDGIHDYLKDARNSILSQIRAFRTGQLEVWDTGTQPRRNISDERITAYEEQLAATEELMRNLGVSFDS